MKVRCSWCDTFGPDKEPFDDPSQSDTICPSCLDKQMKELQKMKRLYKKNPGAAWHEQQAAVAAEAETRAAKKGKKDLAEFFHGKEVAHHESLHKAKSLNMNPGDPSQPGFSTSYKRYLISRGLSKDLFYISKDKHYIGSAPSLEKAKQEIDLIAGYEENPVAVFGMGNPGKRKPEWFYDASARSYFLDLGSGAYSIRRDGDRFKLAYTVGGELTYIREYPEIESAMDQVDHTQGKKFKRPKPLYGSLRSNPGKRKKVQKNPPGTVSARVMGVIYHHCMEIRAEKTGWKPGFYRHPFKRRSGVQILALDNGDLLIHSTKGVKLWERAE